MQCGRFGVQPVRITAHGLVRVMSMELATTSVLIQGSKKKNGHDGSTCTPTGQSHTW